MAEITKDFTNDQSRYEQVVFQRGKKVIDGEQNDNARLQRVRAYRTSMVLDNDDARRAASWGRPRCNNIEIVPGAGADEIDIQPLSSGGASYGLIEFRGYVAEITTPVTLTGVAVVGAADEFQQIYLTIDEEEVTSAGDPSILVADLGETAVRTRVRVQFKLGAVNTDSAAADNTASEPWESGVKASVLAVLSRPALQALPVSQFDIKPLWRPTQTVARWQDRNVVLGADTVTNEAMVVWDLATDQATFQNVALVVPGVLDNTAVRSMSFSIGDGTAIGVPIDNALWAVIYRTKLQADLLTPAIYRLEVNPFPGDPLRGRLIVEPIADLQDLIIDTPDDENLEERYLIGYNRGGEFTLRNGEVQAFTGTTTDRVDAVYFGGRKTLDIPRLSSNSSTTAKDIIPSLRERYIPSSGSMKLLYEAVTTLTPSVKVRMYSVRALNSFDGWVLTHNARWDASTSLWNADNIAPGSSIFRFGTRIPGPGARFEIDGRTAGSATLSWADTAWPQSGGTRAIALSGDGLLTGVDLVTSVIAGFRSLSLTGTSDPVSTTSINNELYAANLPKAWARITTDGASGVVVNDGFNISAIGFNGNGVQVTYGTAFSGTGYAALGTADFTGGEMVNTTHDSASQTTFLFIDDAGVFLDLKLLSRSFDIVVFGRQ